MLPPEAAARVRRFYLYQVASSFAIWIPFWALWIRGNLASDFEFTLVDVAFWVGLLVFQLPRSEEHTSELQSHVNLVCRLLLEKKKKNQTPSFGSIQAKTPTESL